MKYAQEISNKELNSKIEDVISKSLSSRERRSIYFDIFLANMKYGASISDYFNYEFFKKTDGERKEFITEEHSRWLWFAFNDEKYHTILGEKFHTYDNLQQYFGRDFLYINKDVSQQTFLDFCHKHQEIFIKPSKSSWGRGARRIKINKFVNLDDLYHECLEQQMIIEEVIVQHLKLAAFHPASVNTIRINTVITKMGPKIMSAVFRMGNRGSVVDNNHGGGIFAAICVQSGIIFTPGFDKFHKHYVEHPVSNLQIVGFQIPNWEEMKSFALEMVLIVPQNRYIGWDISLSDTSQCILVEANTMPGFILQQAADQIGKLSFYEEALKDY
ncbi:MAG: hypothetical protein K0B14_08250 [Anaerolineaceae bacterium]|nr:hypothetical protein [Anaerolineaceae bacterium]